MDYLLKENTLEIIVLIPNMEAVNKSFHTSRFHRIALMKLALGSLTRQYPGRIFIFLRNTNWVGSMEVREAFMEGIAQVFGIPHRSIYHIEGFEAQKPFLGLFPSIVLPRATDALTEHAIAGIHPRSKVDRFFQDRWNLSSSAIRRWLQLYRIPHPSIRSPAVEPFVAAALPATVKLYIESNQLYLTEIPFFNLKPKILPSADFVPQHHNTDVSDVSLTSYLLTTGTAARITAFRTQAAHLNLAISETLLFHGNSINVCPNGLITHNSAYLTPSRGYLNPTHSPHASSIRLSPSLPYPVTNFELACYLSHHQIWAASFWCGSPHVLIAEDRAVFTSNFATRLKAVLPELAKLDYSLCYLYSRPSAPALRKAGDGELLLTAYVVSRLGLQVLLGKAFPVRRPVDWYVKETLSKEGKNPGIYAASLVERNEELVTTIPKVSHNW
ncbi:hypothetical protein M501DRAFT_1016824 [Patellaria atrata CBS 101060]|uniref:Glycosyl transferase family 25 domain-containing protein n=1 Tax=Patellaria atrata CBS 101060 TaxID=1346257 RepID=A0A9P4VMJ5_9PEZI|nr:hypothetical protein M501DRAFT_1016824 [Patellaria atrata CBS 101060]